MFLKISNLGQDPWWKRVFKTLYIQAYSTLVYWVVSIQMDSSPLVLQIVLSQLQKTEQQSPNKPILREKLCKKYKAKIFYIYI